MENKKGKLGSRLAGSEAFLSVAASLICIVIGLLLGLVVLAIINAEHAFGDGLLVILKSGFKSPRNMGTVLANAAPLIMTGLSVGFAFKTGLFNIGAAGQYTLGAFGALYCAIVLQWPWYLCLLAAMLFGAIWGALPGIFKAYLNINEVITAIMFNWIGEWSIKSANEKYENNKFDSNLKESYILQLLNTDLMISNAFNLNLEQIKELELQFLGDKKIEKEYKKILNSEEYLLKLTEQLDYLKTKQYFSYLRIKQNDLENKSYNQKHR